VVQAARGYLTRAAVARERLRVRRHLHNLLGCSLSVIALRSELTYRLLPEALDLAKEEVGSVRQIAQQLLADVRMVANGYRTMSLAAEAEAALSTLTSAGVDTQLRAAQAALPPGADAVLAVVLREAVANVLRQSKARRCLIHIDEAGGVARLHVTNDGAEDGDAGPVGEWPRMESLRMRLAAFGGRLCTDTDEHGQFHVIAEVPAVDVRPVARPGGSAPEDPVIEAGEEGPGHGAGWAHPHAPRGARPGWTLRIPSLRSVEKWAPQTALLITVTGQYAYTLVMSRHLLSKGTTGIQLAGFAICFAAIFSLHIAHSSKAARRWSLRTRVLTLSAQTIATYLPLLWVGRGWSVMAGFLAGSILLVMGGPVRWILYGAVAGTVVPMLWMHAVAAAPFDRGEVGALVVGLIVYGIGSLQALVFELQAARGSLARIAVVQERLRIAQDLHDLLGYCLSAITLKTELTYRLLPNYPERAREVLAEVLATVRRALVDVHGAATGSCAISLAVEAESASSTLSSAGITVRTDLSCGSPPRHVETVLAIVLREAVMNVLRHSTARHCLIEMTEQPGVRRLHIANDGVEFGTECAAGTGGTGLQNLRSRLAGIGGRLSAGPDGMGWFHLSAEAPESTREPGAVGPAELRVTGWDGRRSLHPGSLAFSSPEHHEGDGQPAGTLLRPGSRPRSRQVRRRCAGRPGMPELGRGGPR